MEKISKNNSKEVIFPADTFERIKEILKNYKELQEKEEKIWNEILEEGNFDLFEQLPSAQITKILKEIAEEKLSSEKMISLLKENLKIFTFTAEKLAKELKEKILNEVVSKEEKPKEKTKEITEEEPKEKRPPIRDIYREPID